MENNCYTCKYRGSLPGDAHSCCRHPKLEGVTNDPIGGLIKSMCDDLTRIKINIVIVELKIKANPHGLRKGWFQYPFNFDPVWLENCNGYTPK